MIPARRNSEGYVAQRLPALNPDRPWVLTWLEDGLLSVKLFTDDEAADWPQLFDAPTAPE